MMEIVYFTGAALVTLVLALTKEEDSHYTGTYYSVPAITTWAMVGMTFFALLFKISQP